ncbi:MAG: class I SAM-dependent methyltransferase [Bacteroidetes bacterium]|nr:class I SAM-dependent methyltransferase [Bacteroidota bacterium]
MDKEKFYDTIADDFDSIMNMYDTNRRIEVIFNDFLGNDNLKNKSLLDGGCGTGLFTKKAIEKGAIVTSLDIAPKLVELTIKKNPTAKGIEGSLLNLPFTDDFFDYVISSDVIEHTPDPLAAVKELIRVLKPGGKICITVPNRSFWYFSVKIAEVLKLRDYQGFENWVHYNELKNFLIKNNIQIITFKGIHLFPFLIPALNPLLYKIDKKTDKTLGKYMVNIAAFGTKK